jgi:hypothetical protein
MPGCIDAGGLLELWHSIVTGRERRSGVSNFFLAEG